MQELDQGRGQGGIGGAKPPQALELAPPNTSKVSPPNMS